MHLKHAHTQHMHTTHTHAHTRKCTHAHTHRTSRQIHDTLEVRRYVFKHNGYAIDKRAGKNTDAHTASTLALKHNGSTINTCAGRNTHTRAHTAATLAQVRRYVLKQRLRHRHTCPGKKLCK